MIYKCPEPNYYLSDKKNLILLNETSDKSNFYNKFSKKYSPDNEYFKSENIGDLNSKCNEIEESQESGNFIAIIRNY